MASPQLPSDSSASRRQLLGFQTRRFHRKLMADNINAALALYMAPVADVAAAYKSKNSMGFSSSSSTTFSSSSSSTTSSSSSSPANPFSALKKKFKGFMSSSSNSSPSDRSRFRSSSGGGAPHPFASKSESFDYGDDEFAVVSGFHSAAAAGGGDAPSPNKGMDSESHQIPYHAAPLGLLEEELDPSAPFPPVDEAPSVTSDFFAYLFGSPLKKASSYNSSPYSYPSSSSSSSFSPTPPSPSSHATPPPPSETTPLHQACRLASPDLLSLLLSRGGDVSVVDGQKRTALHLLCGGVTEGELKQSLPASSSVSFPPLSSFFTTVTEAFGSSSSTKPRSSSSAASAPDDVASQACKNRVKCMKLLLAWRPHSSGSPSPLSSQHDSSYFSLSDRPFSVNSVDVRGLTPLHYAAQFGRTELCLLLLSHGAILTIVENEGQRTAGELAAEQGFHELGATLVAGALYEEDVDCVSLVAEGGADGAMFGDDKDWGYCRAMGGLPLEDADGEVMYVPDEDLGQNLHTWRHLQPPFSWFRVMSPKAIDLDRRARVMEASSIVNGGSGISRRQFTIEQVGIMLIFVNYDTDELSKRFRKNALEFLEACKLSYVLAKPSAGGALASGAVAITDFSFHPPSATPDAAESADTVAALLAPPPPSLKECLICTDEFPPDSHDWVHLGSHGANTHGFCKACVTDYITNAANSRNGLSVKCPHHECVHFIELQTLKENCSADIFAKLTSNENDTFVASAADYKYCPVAGCKCVVKLDVPSNISKRWGRAALDIAPAVCGLAIAAPIGVSPSAGEKRFVSYESVEDPGYFSFTAQPKPAHRFCWSCKKQPHWPVPCDMLTQWSEKLEDEIGPASVTSNSPSSAASFEDVALKLWIKANTKPCPKCQTPIEKNDGCNHMTCSNRHCRYEFCWICRKPWQLHSQQTGGYYKCNKWQEDEELSKSMSGFSPDEAGSSKLTARQLKLRKETMARFVHYYSRWTGHADSSVLEKSMRDSVCTRLGPVIAAAKNMGKIEANSDEERSGLSFIHAAFCELLECRSVLQHSYAFGYYRYSQIRKRKTSSRRKNRESNNLNSEKQVFETIQSELETLTEQISDIAARPLMRASKHQVIAATFAAAQKRNELGKLLIPILLEMKASVAAASAPSDAASASLHSPRRKVYDDDAPESDVDIEEHAAAAAAALNIDPRMLQDPEVLAALEQAGVLMERGPPGRDGPDAQASELEFMLTILRGLNGNRPLPEEVVSEVNNRMSTTAAVDRRQGMVARERGPSARFAGRRGEIGGLELRRANSDGARGAAMSPSIPHNVAAKAGGGSPRKSRKASGDESERQLFLEQAELDEAIRESIRDEAERYNRESNKKATAATARKGGSQKAAPPAFEMSRHFNCTVCTFSNEPRQVPPGETHIVCSMCGSSNVLSHESGSGGGGNEPTVVAVSETVAKKEGSVKEQINASSWTCEFCTLLNVGGDENCVACLAPRHGQGLKKSGAEAAEQRGETSARGESPTTGGGGGEAPLACNERTCGAVACARCTRCGNAFYCSRACQIMDWKRHKKECEELSQRRGQGL